MIFIAAKDTPGMSITSSLQNDFSLLGIKTDLTKAHWCGFVFVLYAGTIIFEKCEYNQTVSYQGSITDMDISVTSMPLKNGNKCSVKINNVDYSMGMRGLNFVVYDLVHDQVTDSVCFDTHSHLLKATRKSEE